MTYCFLQHAAFHFSRCYWWTGVVWIIVMFLASVNCIHCRGTIGVMLHFSKSVPMKKLTHLHLGWHEGEYVLSKFSFLGEQFLKLKTTPENKICCFKYLYNDLFFTQRHFLLLKLKDGRSAAETCFTEEGCCRDRHGSVWAGAEVVASIAGDLFPVFSIAAPIVKLVLDNVESKEAEYMKQQFQKVRDRLEVVSEEVQQINQEIKKSGSRCNLLLRGGEPDQPIPQIHGRPECRNLNSERSERKTFLEHFNRTGGDKNLHTLYNAVTGDNFSGESVLEITLNYEQKSRRAVEEFALHSRNCSASVLIALLGHAALKGDDDEEKLLQYWSERMKVVQDKMIVVIEDCINSFPTQAELDTKRIVRDQSDKSNQQLADLLVEHLKKKYDWVCWSVRVFNSPTGLFTNKKDFHGLTGKSRFQVPSSDDKLNVVVSYSASPEPIDKARIQSLISEQKKITMTQLAELLFETILWVWFTQSRPHAKIWASPAASLTSCTSLRSSRASVSFFILLKQGGEIERLTADVMDDIRFNHYN